MKSMNDQLSAEEVIEIIAKEKNLNPEDVKDMVVETRENLENLVNMQGAAYLLAHNMGINLSQSGNQSASQEVEIKDIVNGMGLITITGRVSRIYQKNTFTRKDGNVGQVQNIDILDQSGSIRVALWDTKAQFIEDNDLQVGNLIRIEGAEPKLGYQDKMELNVGSRAIISTNLVGVDHAKFPEVESMKLIQIDQITDATSSVTILGKITAKYPANEFERKDGSTGKVMSIVVTDTSSSIRITFWDDSVNMIQSYDVGDIVKLVDLKVNLNQNNLPELSFQRFSQISKHAGSDDLKKIEVQETTTGEVLPISEISATSKNFSVEGKIVDIFPVREFSSENSSGKVQSMVIMDNTGTIRINFWGDQVDEISASKSDDFLRVTSVYPKFNDYSQSIEINAGKYSTISLNPDDLSISPEEIKPQFILFKDITGAESAISIKLKILEKLEVREITRRNDQSTGRVQNLNVMDEGGERGRLTAWDDDIDHFDNFEENQTVAVTFARAKRDDYGVNVTLGRNSTMEETNEFSADLIFQSADQLTNSQDPMLTTAINELQENTVSKVEALVVKIFEKLGFYNSCSNCLKKVIEDIDGSAKCPEHGDTDPKRRMIVSCTLDDSSKTITAKFFANNAEKFLGISADEAWEIQERLADDTAAVTQQKSTLIMREISVVARVQFNQRNEELELAVNKFNWMNNEKKTDEILDRYSTIFDE